MSFDAAEYLSKISHMCSDSKVSGEKIVHRVFKTSYEMILDQNFTISYRCRTLDEIMEKIKTNSPILVGHQESKRVSLFILNDEKIGVKLARQIIEDHEGKLIIISLEGPTAFTKKEIASYPDCGNVIFFTISDLVNNISRHSLVPKMRKLDPEEKKSICQKYNVDEGDCPKHFPNMLREDPMRKYYDFQKGDLIEIKRKGIGYEEMVYYRCVL